MENLDTREWLLTNGLGSFASGTVCDARTRTYHGWLIAAVDPPSQRTLLLSHLDASLEIAGQVWALATNFWIGGNVDPLGYQLLRSFEIDPVPTWTWSQMNWQLSRQMVMPYGLRESSELEKESTTQNSKFKTQHSILIQYRYEGSESAILRLRPLIGDRSFHLQQSAETSGLHFSQLVGQQQLYLQAIRPELIGTPWQLRWSRGDYQPEGVWYWNYYYPEENRRGLIDYEDLYSPGYLTVTLKPGDTITLEARVGEPLPEQPNLSCGEFEQAVLAEQQRLRLQVDRLRVAGSKPPSSLVDQDLLLQPSTLNPQPSTLQFQLMRAADQFITYRTSAAGPTVMAGYHWFNDRGRDMLIALPGLTLSAGRFSLAKELLETFGRYCREGLIPNTFSEAGTEPLYNSIDTSLWWIEALGLYLEATQDWDFLAQQYSVVRQIYKGFVAGTLYNIRIDATDGLITWNAPGVALTWMDVVIDGQPVTPRRGKPIEVNALWYSALCWAKQWAEQLSKKPGTNAERLMNQQERYTQQAEQVKTSLQKFWNPARQYFYDTIEPDDVPDPRIRPNAVLALSLYHCGFPAHQARSVLQVARERLLTPYGLRSLDSADYSYIGTYGGNSRHRDYAYHQGTVWCWLIGSFIRVWKRFYDSQPLPFDWQPLLEHFQTQKCLGSVSEIFDGDPPHAPQGAVAQAWSVAEIIRHLKFD